MASLTMCGFMGFQPRYALYDHDDKTGKITLRRCSAHGLGHLQNLDEKQWWGEIIAMHYDPRSRKCILNKHKTRYAFSQLTISTFDVLGRFERLNKDKPLTKMIKPYNFITVGTGYRESDENEPIIPMLSYVNPKRTSQIPFTPFIDYRTGTAYPKESSLDPQYYWRPMSEVMEQ